MAVNEIELEEKLKETGNTLLNPPTSIDQLLNLLDKLEHLLINVDQQPSRSMQDALLLPMKALISSTLLRHLDTDVRISVAACISEITRITAPDAPYNDEQMKEIFQLILEAFEKLVHESSRCYSRAVSILVTVAKVRSCLMMLDLELDGLIVNMFQNFFKFIRSHHPHTVFLAMETIMSLVIGESEDLSLDLLTSLLASVRKENKDVSPSAWKLGEKVIKNCASNLKPYLKSAIEQLGGSLDNYSPIVSSICQEASQTLECDSSGYSEDKMVPKELNQADTACPEEVLKAVGHCQISAARESIPSTINMNDTTSNMLESNAEPIKLVKQIETVRKKRGRKPSSLMNPEEGNDNPRVHMKKLAKLHCERKPHENGTENSPRKYPVSVVLSLPHMNHSQKDNEVLGASSPSLQRSPIYNRKRGRPKKENAINQNGNHNSLSVSKEKILGDYPDDTAPESDDARLKMAIHERSNGATKERKRFKKIGLSTMTDKETSPSMAFVVSEKKFNVQSDPGKKSHLSAKVRGRPRGNSSLSAQAGARKTNSVIGSLDEDDAEGSSEKETKLSSRDQCYQERTPKTKLKGKIIPKKEMETKLSSGDLCYQERTPKTKLKGKIIPKKEMASETPDYGFQLIGIKIKVWWPQDKTFYEGVVESYDPVKKKHRVLYADGDEETLNLRKQRWEIIEDSILPDQRQDLVMHGTPSGTLQKRKPNEKVKLELERQMQDDSSLNRSRTASASTSKARKSGSTSSDCGGHQKAVDASPSKVGFTVKDDGKVSPFTLKIKGPKPPKKSKPIIPETTKSLSKDESHANENERNEDRTFQSQKLD